ncbi:MAG TPA: MBL fold metallo-hydrolase [Micropepsaceae bacterium]|jgi:glyoxylase-like metal-dependent hydrolase (beta-lactamase superfamily II)
MLPDEMRQLKQLKMESIMRTRTAGLFTVTVLAFFGMPAFAQVPDPGLTVTKLKDNIYMAEGGGGASTIIIGQNGVIVVDAKNRPPDGKQLVDEVGKLTNKPITTVILTHSDPDHVRGLGGFPKGLNLTVIAHENDKKEIEKDLAAGGLQSPPKEYLPNKIITQMRESITVEGVKMTLIHIAPAHTSGDLAVYFPDYKLVASGDLIGDGDPTIHLFKNGSSEGWIKFVSALVDLDADTYVRGHAGAGTREQVRQSLANAEAKRARIADLVKQGKSLDDIKQAFGEPLKSANRFQTFTETTYEELTRK